MAVVTSDAALESSPAKFGTAEEVERHILLREVLSVLTPEERFVCISKMQGFSSQERKPGGHHAGYLKIWHVPVACTLALVILPAVVVGSHWNSTMTV